jgi:hypothetical protein
MAPTSETGSESVGMAVATKRRRNRKITSTTSTMVPNMVSVTSCSASRIDTERSFSVVMRTDCGSCARKPGSAARTESTTLTVFASVWRRTARLIEVSPLTLAEVFTVSKLSSTCATSRRRTGLPLRLLMISSANSAALRSCLLACSVRVCFGPSSVPTGVLTLAALKAALSSSRLMLRAASASGSTRTRTAKRFWPKMLTCATPSSVDSVGTIRCSA